jgi:hypothetical protein
MRQRIAYGLAGTALIGAVWATFGYFLRSDDTLYNGLTVSLIALAGIATIEMWRRR